MARYLRRRLRALLVAAAALAAASAAAAADLPIYGDGLESNWVDWSWDVTRNLSNAAPTHAGSASASVQVTAAWGALYLHAGTPVSTGAYHAIRFWVHGGASGGQQLRVVANGRAPAVAFTAQAGTWTEVSIPLSNLGSPAVLTDLYWADAKGSAQPAFFLDDIALVMEPGSGGGGPPVAGPALAVDVGADRHAISSDIYGVNQVQDEALATALRLPLRRWGGNSTSRYNWQNDTTNTGSDWYYENIAHDNPAPAALPDGSAADRFVEQNRRTATRSLVTLPMIGWVARRRTAGHPFDCGFKVSRYGAQQSTDPWDPDCGNGLANSGGKLGGNDPTDTSTAVGPDFAAAWIGHLVGRYGSAANGGVAYYAFDNEPMLWNSTHRDVHPLPTSYDEMRDRTYQYGAAVKAADPSAKTLGPVEWGWCGYLYSAADPNGCSAGADTQAHGGIPFVAWYLQQMRGYEQQHALRILDYLDLHAYPYANGVALAAAGDASTQALRLRSTRSLWDPSYIDESWVSDTASGGVAIQMIPRMRKWAADNYPGTRLAITEYNWGGMESVNGALAQADVLGIFGREGLDLATLWGDLTSMQPAAFAFRMYRNYDGAGHGFGDVAVRSSSADQGRLAVYSAQRSADGVLTIVVVNKTANDLTSSIGLTGFDPQPTASVYRYGQANPAAIEHAADQPLTASGFTATFAANSVTLFAVAAVNHQGLWWNPQESGWGINFAHQGDIVFATWFTYDAARKPWWLIAQLGKHAGQEVYSGTVSTVTGPPFNAVPFPPGGSAGGAVETPVGTMTATFADAGHATIAYAVNGAAQTRAIVPQAFGALPTCTWGAEPNLALATNYTDLWWNPQEAGWGVNFTHQGDTIFATWFTYDGEGRPWWLIALLNRTAGGTYAGGVSTVTGPPLGTVPFPAEGSAGGAVETPVGTATVAFADGNRASFVTTVNGVSQSKPITRQVFVPPGTACR